MNLILWLIAYTALIAAALLQYRCNGEHMARTDTPPTLYHVCLFLVPFASAIILCLYVPALPLSESLP